jgi:hypothetical protein
LEASTPEEVVVVVVVAATAAAGVHSSVAVACSNVPSRVMFASIVSVPRPLVSL